MEHSIYTSLHDSIDTITIQSNDSENYNITPSRSSLKNINYEQMKQDIIIKSLKKLVLRIINIFILFLSLPILVSDIVIITYTKTTNIGYCVYKLVNLINSKNTHLYSYVPFSLMIYYLTDVFLSIIILLLLYYFINIENYSGFCFNNYKNILNFSKFIILLQLIWLILGILTIIDKELDKICEPSIYTFTYFNLFTRGILLIIITSIVINNYYIL